MPLFSLSRSKMGSRARMLLTGLLAALVAVLVAGSVGTAAQAPVTSAQLQQVAASLQMYVDALPQMPKILGYGFQQGRVVPVNLTIGMFQKNWVQIPPRPPGDAGVRLRAVPRQRHVPGPDHRRPARRAAGGDVGEPPPRPPRPAVGPHGAHRHPQERRRPHRRPPPRQRPPAAVRRQRLRLVHGRVPRDGPRVDDGHVPLPQRAAPGQPVVPRPRAGPHPRQPPRRPARRLHHREARGGHAHGPPLRRRRPPPRHRRPQLLRRRLPLHELHGRRPERAPAVAARVLRRGRHRQRQGVAVPRRAPPPLPPPHPQRQQRALLQPHALQRPPLPRRRLRRVLPRRAGHRAQPPRRAGRDLRRRRRLLVVPDGRGRDAQLGAVPVPDRRRAGRAQREGDEVRGHAQRAARPAGQLHGAGPRGAVRERGVAGAHVGDEAHRHVRVPDAVGPVHAPLHQRAASRGPRHGDAAVGDHGALARHQPHRRQPPAAHPPGHVTGRQDAAAPRPADLHRLHDEAQRRRQVQRRPARGRARRAGAGPREDVEERRQGAAGVRHHGGRGVQAGGHQPELPLRRHGGAWIRLPLPHPGSRRQRHDPPTEAASMKRSTKPNESMQGNPSKRIVERTVTASR